MVHEKLWCEIVCVCGYGLWITHGSRVVLAVGALRVAWGALQCTQTIGKCPLGALMGAPGCGYVVVPAFHIPTSQEAAAAGEVGFNCPVKASWLLRFGPMSETGCSGSVEKQLKRGGREARVPRGPCAPHGRWVVSTAVSLSQQGLARIGRPLCPRPSGTGMRPRVCRCGERGRRVNHTSLAACLDREHRP